MVWNLNSSGSLIVASRTNNVQTASYEDSSIAKILTKFDKAAAVTIIRWSSKYHKGAIISHSLYIFYPIFTAVDIVTRLVLQTKAKFVYVSILVFLTFFAAPHARSRALPARASRQCKKNWGKLFYIIASYIFLALPRQKQTAERFSVHLSLLNSW